MNIIAAIGAQESEIIIDGALTGGDWLRAGSIAVVAVVVAIITNRVVRHVIIQGVGPGFAALITARLISYIVFLLGLFYALNSLGVRVGPLLGALGLGGLILALALQKPVENFVAAIILQTGRPFSVGDTVQLGAQMGTVLDIESRTTVLRGLDGTIIRVPNANVAADTIINLTREPQRRSTLVVGVTYDTALDVATESLRSAVNRVPRIFDEPAPLIVLSEFAESSIEFTVLYWHESDNNSERMARHDLMLAIHQDLTGAGITIAFPQMVLWEGKDPTGPEYRDLTAPVQTEHPGHLSTPSRQQRRSPNWRRALRQE